MSSCLLLLGACTARTHAVYCTNVPGYTWSHTQLFKQELVAKSQLVDNTFVVYISLIRHAPAAVDEL